MKIAHDSAVAVRRAVPPLVLDTVLEPLVPGAEPLVPGAEPLVPGAEPLVPGAEPLVPDAEPPLR